MTFSIKDFHSKCDQTRREMRIWPHLLKKYLMENFIFKCGKCKEAVIKRPSEKQYLLK